MSVMEADAMGRLAEWAGRGSEGLLMAEGAQRPRGTTGAPSTYHRVVRVGRARDSGVAGQSRLVAALSPLAAASLVCLIASLAPGRGAASEREGAAEALSASGISAAEIHHRIRALGFPDTLVVGRDARSPRGGESDGGRQVSPKSSEALAPVESPAPEPAPQTLPARPADPRPSTGPKPFGYEFFSYTPTTFEPLVSGPVDPEYPLGPGDELILTLWGDDQLSLALTVSREGAVLLPEAGQVVVNGLTLEQARSRIHAALSGVYSGLRPPGQRATTFLDVSLGKLRSIQVFILGQVVRPGGYTVSSVSRVLNALYAAGGPTTSGSLREIRLMRSGREVGSIDLYDAILRGDTSKEKRLQNGDVIFVPMTGRRIEVVGPVRRQAIFELKRGENLRVLLEITGGLEPNADVERAQIERIVPAEQRDSLPAQDRVAIDVALRSVLVSSADDIPLWDGDRLTLFSIGERRINTVRVEGRSVLRPGTFERRSGMRVRDLVAAAGGVLPDAFLGRALLTRTLPDRSRVLLRVDLGRALSGDSVHDIELEPLDELAVASVWDLRERYSVTLHGAVRKPGTYEYFEGMTLYDLLFRAGGLTDDAAHARAEIARVDSHTVAGRLLADTITVVVDRNFAALPEPSNPGSFALKAHDAVFVRRDPDYTLQNYVVLSGEFRFPGAYALHGRQDRIREVVARAGGVTELAHPQAAVFTRPGIGRLAIDLPSALRNPRSRSNFILKAGDEIKVPRHEPVVIVEGAVRNPVGVLYRPGAGLSYYVEQASGYLREADRGATVVVMANGLVRKAGRFGSPTPDAGSRIVVPLKAPTEGRETLKDAASFVSLMTGAATMIYLIRQVSR